MNRANMRFLVLLLAAGATAAGCSRPDDQGPIVPPSATDEVRSGDDEPAASTSASESTAVSTEEDATIAASEAEKGTVDWVKAEQAYFDHVEAAIKAFAADHLDEEFYGTILSCDYEYASILLYFNTEEALQETVNRYKTGSSAELYADQSREEVEEELRWSGGDWSFEHDPESSPAFEQAQSQIVAAFEHADEDDWDRVLEEFLEMCCRVGIRLERSGAFDAMKRTPDFRVLSLEEEESVEDGEARMRKVRESFEGR